MKKALRPVRMNHGDVKMVGHLKCTEGRRKYLGCHVEHDVSGWAVNFFKGCNPAELLHASNL
eukprot:483569-Pelagomonas_calceolata.AAC.7